MLRTRFVMLALSKASERLNKQTILFIAETPIAGTLNFGARLSNQNIQIIRLICSINPNMGWGIILSPSPLLVFP